MSQPVSLSQLPRYDGSCPAGAIRVDRKGSIGSVGISRRSFIGGAVAVGIGVGMATLGVFPPAKRALAHHGAMYQIKPLPCPGYYQPGWQDCVKDCGPSCTYPNACNTSGHYTGYHKNDGTNWTLRPNECLSGTGFDGWTWRVEQDCGISGCNDWVKFRCHDGHKIGASCPGYADNSVCKAMCDCGGMAGDNCVTD